VHRDPHARLHKGVRVPAGRRRIVADSDPQAEQQECLNKLAALETAIRLAEARS
jgi:anthranilate/para-aminobenzoate synthase component I